MAARLSEAAGRAAAGGAEPSQEGQGLSAIVLVGGFGLPSTYLVPLARRLRDRGNDVALARLGANVDCSERAVQKLLRQLRADTTVIGHSRGGQLALVAALRRPDLVTRLITVATPWSIGPPDRPGVAAVGRAVKAVRRRGLDVLASIECADGPCCAQYRADLQRKPAARWTALWSSTDSIAGADGRPPDTADEMVDARTSHLGILRRVPSVLP